MNLIDIYSKDFPVFIEELINTTEFKRLKNVGMNCGCEYTSFPIFAKGKDYTRYDHSIGVALIIWNFTKDIKQSIAGLLHDISSPVFAHVIDFLNGDHETQESTEEKTEEIIENSLEIQAILRRTYSYNKDLKSDIIKFKDITLNIVEGKIYFKGENVDLTKNELKIMNILMSNQEKIVTREEIIEELWDTDEFISENTLTVNVNRLRKKLKSIGLEDVIGTKKGQGYIIR